MFIRVLEQLFRDCNDLSFCFQLSATLTIPFWQWFLTRFGKKTAVYVGTLVSSSDAELAWLTVEGSFPK